MPMQEATFRTAGQTFIGRFRVVGSGKTMTVLVQYGTSIICARKGTLPEREVAETLLGELVQETLQEGSRGRRH